MKLSVQGGAGYKTLLLAVNKTSLFFGGSEVAAYKTSLFFEVPKWLSIKPYFFGNFKKRGNLTDFNTKI